MALRDYMNTPFCLLDRVSTADPFGGVVYTYVEGAHFAAGMVTNATTEMQIAEQSGAKSVYTLVVDRHTVLERGQLVRRLTDGSTYRITAPTRDMQTPEQSALKFAQTTMERVEV